MDMLDGSMEQTPLLYLRHTFYHQRVIGQAKGLQEPMPDQKREIIRKYEPQQLFLVKNDRFPTFIPSLLLSTKN